MKHTSWIITLIVIITFCVLTIGVVLSIHTDTKIVGEWKEILILLLGAFIGSYGKVIDYWFGDKEQKKKDNEEEDNK